MTRAAPPPAAVALRQTPEHILRALKPRETQIIPLELLASAGLLYSLGEQVRGRDVIFFIDNQSVCAALAKGCSKSEDLQAYTTCWHRLAQLLGCRVWFEWVDSKSNPADELSRKGTSEYSKDVEILRLPKWADRSVPQSLAESLDLLE